VPALPQDIYNPADLVTAEQSLYPSLPATGGREGRADARQLGAVSSQRHRSEPVTRLIHPTSMGCAQADQLVVLTLRRTLEISGMGLFQRTHHPRLGFPGRLPYSAARGKHSMSRKVLDELKCQIPLLDYLQAHDWQPARRIAGGRLMGICPLYTDASPVSWWTRTRTLLLLRVWSRRRRDSFRRTLPSGEVFPSRSTVTGVVRPGAVAGSSH
jgi:hypothetical protein